MTHKEQVKILDDKINVNKKQNLNYKPNVFEQAKH